ncbi:hypothetical protein [Sphingomonas hankookensis]
MGNTLLAQGERETGGMLNFGYRRELDRRYSLNLTRRKLLNSFRIRSTYDTPLFRDRSGQHLKLISVLISLTYNLGSTPRRQPEQFDFTTLPTGDHRAADGATAGTCHQIRTSSTRRSIPATAITDRGRASHEP